MSDFITPSDPITAWADLDTGRAADPDYLIAAADAAADAYQDAREAENLYDSLFGHTDENREDMYRAQAAERAANAALANARNQWYAERNRQPEESGLCECSHNHRDCQVITFQPYRYQEFDHVEGDEDDELPPPTPICIECGKPL